MSEDTPTPASILRPGRDAAYKQFQEALPRLLILKMIDSETMWELSNRVPPPSMVELQEQWDRDDAE